MIDNINTLAAIAGILSLFVSVLALMQAVVNYEIYLPGVSQSESTDSNPVDSFGTPRDTVPVDSNSKDNWNEDSIEEPEQEGPEDQNKDIDQQHEQVESEIEAVREEMQENIRRSFKLDG